MAMAIRHAESRGISARERESLQISGYYNLYGLYSSGDVGTGVPIFLSSHASLACLRTGFISTTFTCASLKKDGATWAEKGA